MNLVDAVNLSKIAFLSIFALLLHILEVGFSELLELNKLLFIDYLDY
jgi:hypothetical protein